MSTVSIRYIANDVDAAVEFYTALLGFELEMHPAPGFAVTRFRTADLLPPLAAAPPGRCPGKIIGDIGRPRYSFTGQ